MVDILRLGEEIKKERRRNHMMKIYICPHPAMQGGHKEETTVRKYNGLPYFIGRP